MKRLVSMVLAGVIISCVEILALAQTETKNISGTVKSVSIEKKEIVLESINATTGSAEESTVKVNEATEIEYGLILDDIIAGDEMDVEYIIDDKGDKIAKSVRFIDRELEEPEPEITKEGI